MFNLFNKAEHVPDAATALPGRDTPLTTAEEHFVLGNPLKPPFPDDFKTLIVGMGCFWGVERKFWAEPGIWTTAVGYASGYTQNPTYQEVCTGQTGHNEVVLVVYDPNATSLEALLKLFWESHDPTQGMQQGNDRGTQYRSGIYLEAPSDLEIAKASQASFQAELSARGYGTITTEILPQPEFYYAEDYHQQYLAKNPNGYCGLGGTGVTCPIALPTR